MTGLSEDERSEYWEDYKVVGALFCLRPEEMPRTLAELRDYRDMLSSGRLVITPWAGRRARKIVLEPPVPLYARPLVEAANFVTIALLPTEIRRHYRFLSLPPATVRRAVVAGGAEYVKRAVIPFLPDSLRLVPAARAA